jgi:Domain of unknown function (DUF6398)
MIDAPNFRRNEMSVCTFCNNEMTTGAPCVPVPIATRSGFVEPIRYGSERGVQRPDRLVTCGDCGVEPGAFHHRGCDLERCPSCLGQLLSCACDMSSDAETTSYFIHDDIRLGDADSLDPDDMDNIDTADRYFDDDREIENCDCPECLNLRFGRGTNANTEAVLPAKLVVAVLTAVATYVDDDLTSRRIDRMLDSLWGAGDVVLSVKRQTMPEPQPYFPPYRAWDPLENWRTKAVVLERLAGGVDKIAEFDVDTPLPDEAFDDTGVPVDLALDLAHVLTMVDHCCDAMFDVEHRTACRRLLNAIVGRDSTPFRRFTDPRKIAAALCWIVGKANASLSPRDGILVRDLMAHFGLPDGTVSTIGDQLLSAGGFDREKYRDFPLGSARYLTVKRRRQIQTEHETTLERLAS